MDPKIIPKPEDYSLNAFAQMFAILKDCSTLIQDYIIHSTQGNQAKVNKA